MTFDSFFIRGINPAGVPEPLLPRQAGLGQPVRQAFQHPGTGPAQFPPQQRRQFLRLVVPPTHQLAAVHGHGNEQALFSSEPVGISAHGLRHHPREGSGQMNGPRIFEGQQKLPQCPFVHVCGAGFLKGRRRFRTAGA